ncbi:uncharacterized protein METZ01_LOCUS187671, partial [marine metagenome]
MQSIPSLKDLRQFGLNCILFAFSTQVWSQQLCPGSYNPATWNKCLGSYDFASGNQYLGEFRDGQ